MHSTRHEDIRGFRPRSNPEIEEQEEHAPGLKYGGAMEDRLPYFFPRYGAF
jgi:hypothetical protein